MSNKLSAVLILCMSTMCLAGCDLLRVSGPCYGVGCPGGSAGHSGQYRPGEAPKAQNASAPAPARNASAPAQADSAQPSSAQAAAARQAPTQDASSEAKSSPLHSISDFFSRLIPHHNSGAKSGASD